MDVNNIFYDIDKHDDENITYVKPVNFPSNRNIGIFVKNKQKLIVRTPKMYVPFDVKIFKGKNQSQYRLNIGFNTLPQLHNEIEINKFYKFVNAIDELNMEVVKLNRKKWGMPNLVYKPTINSISDDFPEFMPVNLPFDSDFLFDIYDENKELTTIDCIHKKSIIGLALELTDLWIGENECGCNWNVLQIRKFSNKSIVQELFNKQCLIIYDEPIIKIQVISQSTTSIPVPPPAPNFFLPNKPTQSNQQNQPKPISTFIPTTNDLQSAMSKLKKTETVVKTMYDGKILKETSNELSPTDKSATEIPSETPKKKKKKKLNRE